MSKNVKIGLIVVAVAVAGYLAWRWWQNRQASQAGNPAVPVGTNLNSTAPQLIGGSTGPNVGPAVSLPVNITLTQPATSASQMPDTDGDEMDKGGRSMQSPLNRQRHIAGVTSGPDGNVPADVTSAEDASGDQQPPPGADQEFDASTVGGY